MKYSKMTREKCNMLNVWNFKFKKKVKPKKMQSQSTEQENAKTNKTKLRDTKIFQTEVIWNCQDY